MKNQIAFYINSSSYSDMDFRRIYYGNPGIGGSEYMKLLIAYLLTIRDNNISVTVFLTGRGVFPKEMKISSCSSLKEAIKIADSRRIDYFICDHIKQNMDTIEEIQTTSVRFILWCHNFASLQALDRCVINESISIILNVGREQMDIYRDHPSFNKMEYIFNCISTDCVDRYNVKSYPIKNRKNIVTYIGAINRYKGFHRLAQAWPRVIEQVPDAELYVIGAGNLYDKTVKLGKWGIAEEEYENYFMQYLTKDGKILDSVHFMGILGEEKNDILLRTKVGVPNPTGASETFCISALEMQMMGATIVSKECAGFLDTVLTGRLVKNYNLLVDGIVKELKNPQDNYDKVVEEVKRKFSYENVAHDWEILIREGKINRQEKLNNVNFRFKGYKEVFRKIKVHFPILNIIPPLEALYTYYKRKSNHFRAVTEENRYDYIDLF